MKQLTNEELNSKAEKMQAFLQIKGGSEPNDIIDRIEKLNILMAESGELLSVAKYNQDQVISSEVMKVIKEGYSEKLSAMTLNKFITALAKEQNYLVNVFDRINASAVHQLDAARSVLSYKKTEFSTLNYTR